MILIVAEKAPAARRIVPVVEAFEQRKGYFEGNGHIVTYCRGHLIELAMPDAYDPKYKEWCLEDLPFLPRTFKTQVIASSMEQYGVVRSLMNREDVTEIVSATDAGREGELIFRLVYEKAGCTKPVKRLWCSSLEEKAIAQALRSMQDMSAYDGLADAGYGRMCADYLVGINLSRLYTKLYNSPKTLNCGRVQTPVVAEIVRRQRLIDTFKPVAYYNVVADLGDFKATCRLDDKEQALELAYACKGEKGTVVKAEKVRKKDNAPLLYNTTDLLRDANRILGYQSKVTMETAESLYLKGLLTYPRVDSRYISSDMEDVAVQILEQLTSGWLALPEGFEAAPGRVARLINDAKIVEHPAITPTESVTEETFAGLSAIEKNVLLLVMYRFLIALSDPYLYDSSLVEVVLCDNIFVARGREPIELGWRAVAKVMRDALGVKQEKKKGDEGEAEELPALSFGDTRTCVSCKAVEKFTEPPKPYTENTLLAFMANAGKKETKGELREAMTDEKGEWKGIGTGATRTNIIEGIIEAGFVKREKKNLVPTTAAFVLAAAVTPELVDPSLTVEWERQLADICEKKLSLDEFLDGVRRFCQVTVHSAEVNPALVKMLAASKFENVGKCPRCGKTVVMKKSRSGKVKYECATNRREKREDGTWKLVEGCGFEFWGDICGKSISKASAKQLCERGRTNVIKGFTSKKGGTFDAAVQLVEKDGKTVLGFIFPDKSRKAAGAGSKKAERRA